MSAPRCTIAPAVATVPTLFLDTCALLEIIRFAQRPRAQLSLDVEAAWRLLSLHLNAPSALALVTSDVVAREWGDNEVSVLSQVEKHLLEVDEHIRRVAECSAALGSGVQHTLMSTCGLPKTLHYVANAMLSCSLLWHSTPGVERAAFLRQFNRRGPSRKGKDCLNDCIVAEALIDFARQTSGVGRGPIVFLTYNHRDFCDGGRRVHADLASDFSSLNIHLALSWSWAAHSLGL